MDSAGKNEDLLEKQGFCWKNMDFAGKTWIFDEKNLDVRRKITVFDRLLSKRRDTETGSAPGETLEKISKHMIHDIEIDNRGVDFSGPPSCFFICFWQITMVVLSWDESVKIWKIKEIYGNLGKSRENRGFLQENRGFSRKSLMSLIQ